MVVVGLVFACHAEGAAPAFPPPIEEHHLANGLRVVLAPDDTMSDVSVVVRYEAGQADDPDGREGLAHVTEHVLFGAFRHGAHAKLLLQVGASNLNAHTGLDFTSFEETVSPEALDLALWLEGARMATAADAVDETEVVRERTVAGLEYRQYGHGGRGLLALIDPCDAARRIEAVAPDDVRAVMRMYFAEKRLGVVVIAREDQLDAWPADLDMGPVQRRDWLGQDLP
jgi:predicted Zn-dependent peptidase